jgi:ATP-dependent DNA helicase RecG
LAAGGEAPLGSLPGVTPKVLEKLNARGLNTLQDLWLHLPRSYEDRTQLTSIRDLRPGVAAQIEGHVELAERSFRYRPMLRAAVSDGSHATVVLRFFHFRGAQAAQFQPGARIRCYGTPRAGQHGLEIVHPSYQILAEGAEAALGDRLDPVYPAVEGIGPATLRKFIGQALDRLPDDAQLELLPERWRREHDLPSLRSALLMLHRPRSGEDLAAFADGRHPAQRRLVLEELLAHHLSLRCQRLAMQRQHAPALPDARLAMRLQQSLPFELTAAQQRVFGQIRKDLARPVPMQRLIQGDVGSGKTVVAAMAIMLAVAQDKQAVMAAPTELLAEQHLRSLQQWLVPLGVDMVWLAGKVTGKARKAALEAIASGAAQVAVGTHALMQEGVEFHDLALVVVDEQHRFGVQQRLALREKGSIDDSLPHQLVMTATPIPRTLAMTAYADLDVSAIDELPPGRTPVRTVAVGSERRPELIERIRVACAEGRQVYWVCTLIDEAEEEETTKTAKPVRPGPAAGKVEAQAAQTTYESLLAQLPGVRVGLVHGRLKPAEKRRAMNAFKTGEIDLLVATTVIEVGMDVPNASLMVIENAERLGLAQLHQLRGRVGRGAAASSCVLLYQPPLSLMAKQRLATLRRTNDGFLIAERDLELRGPGELLGTRQTGLASFRIADLARDIGLLPQVHAWADELLAHSPELADRIVKRWVGGAARFVAA